MTRDDIYEKLTEIFRENFDDDSIVLRETTSSEDIDDWDSLEQLNLIAVIQGEFQTKFTMDEVSSMKNVGVMVDVITRKLERK